MAEVLFESGDSLDEANIAEVLNFGNLIDYFDTGCGYTPDHVNQEVTANSGKAYISDGGSLYAVKPDQETLPFATTSGDNYLYLTYDPATDDSASWEISDTLGGPADPKLLRATIDASNDTDTSDNDEPDLDADLFRLNDVGADPSTNGHATNNAGDVKVQSGGTVVNLTNVGAAGTQLDTGTLTASGGSVPAVDATAANVNLSQDTDYWVLLYVDADPAFSADYKFNWNYSHNWDDTNSEVDLDFTVNWDTDPGAGNDVTLRWEVRQP